MPSEEHSDAMLLPSGKPSIFASYPRSLTVSNPGPDAAADIKKIPLEERLRIAEDARRAGIPPEKIKEVLGV